MANAVNGAAEQSSAERCRRLEILARADRELLESVWASLGEPAAFRRLKQPETGLVMLRARAGGTGRQFNFGEMTLTRCVVALEADGLMGVGYVPGRDTRKAELVALFDALAQRAGFAERIEREIVQPVAQTRADARRRRDAKVAATKVDFFTMVRGED